LAPITLAGANLPGLLFMTIALLWTLAATMSGRYLVRVIVALMLVYPVVEALLLAATALFAFPGLPSYRAEALGPLVPPAVPVRIMIQMIFGFFAAGGILIAFGLAGLAPAVFASSVFGLRLHAIRPDLSRTRLAIVVTVGAWLLVVTGFVARIYNVIGIVGGLLAPVAGAIAADYVLSRGNWPGPRQGYNRPGILAW